MYTLLVTGDVPGASTYFNPMLQQTIIPCTSGTRPSSPPDGMMVWETDTDMFRYRFAATSKWRSIASAVPSVLLSKSSATISNNTVTTVSWTSALKNDFGMWAGGSPTIITAPCNGVFLVSLYVRWASQATVAGFRQARIDVGGAEQNVFNLAPSTALNATNVTTNLGHPMQLNTGDQIECKVYQNSGANLDIVSPTRVLVTMISEE